jgi:uncharacterized protein (DUF1015 family)
MPELSPFAGICYSATEELKDLVCPPYDVISPEEQLRLHRRHPHNAVRIELPFSERPDEPTEARYRRAGAQFRDWLREGVLVQHESSSVFVYRQDFRSLDGMQKSVTGVIGALGLEPWNGSGGVLPHEHTMPGPVEDRLALLHACPVNLSPLYAIYQGAGELAPFLESLLARPPAARVPDEHGTLHRLWIVRAPAEMAMLTRAIGDHPLVIADGHHRYETALAYREERRGLPGHHDAVMCLCVDVDAQDVEVLPYHRVFRSTVDPTTIVERLSRHFATRVLDDGEGPSALSDDGSDYAYLVVLPETRLLVTLDEQEGARGRSHVPAPLGRFDVVALHEVVLPTVFPEDPDEIGFLSDSARVTAEVAAGKWSGGILLRPLRPEDIVEVAIARQRTPQKASYFSPKILTGLVFRSLE